MTRLLEGKVAVVTGAGRGIGRGIALLMAEEGARVVVNDLGSAVDGAGTDRLAADEVAQKIRQGSGEAVPNYDSVTTPESAERIIKAAIDSFGRLDILVTSAGILRDRMIFNMTPDEWDAVVKVHLYGTFYCIRYAAPIFRAQHSGRIISMSSEAGLGGVPGQANYGSAKEGIIGLIRSVALDLGKYGVTCNAIRPAAGTRMTLSPEQIASWEKSGLGDMVATLRSWSPDDIAPFVVYLASDEAAYINGYDFQIHGNIIGIFSQPVVTKTIYTATRWTVEELRKTVPATIAAGLVNPALLGKK